MLIHATCVDINGKGVLITGPSGAGKSDLALRLIDGGARLVADDQVDVDGALKARCPETIRGQIEARYIGLLKMTSVETVLALAVEPGIPERLPEPQSMEIEGRRLPLLRLPYFEASTPAKIRLWLAHGTCS